jgi:hypothetical protein
VKLRLGYSSGYRPILYYVEKMRTCFDYGWSGKPGP